MKKHIKTVTSLTVICLVVALLLSVTNYITEPIIEKNEFGAVQEALKVVLPQGEDFNAVDIEEYDLPETVTEVYSEKNGSYAFKMVTTGYASGLTILCGIDKEGKVVGATCIASSETNGAENTYGEKLIDKTIKNINSVDTVTGSTKTTVGYRNAVKDALNSFAIINGGTVDNRSEEEILQDNLNKALPSGEGKFTSLFIAEDIGNIAEVYVAENNTGFVFLLGEEFIATDEKGNVITETGDENKTAVNSAAVKIINSKQTEIDLSGYPNMPANIRKAFNTESGNYVFEVNASGYGVSEGYSASGEYIKIKVSVTGEGKIISCVTLSQGESKDYGAACEKKNFYSQFNGKDQTNYMNIDAITGATVTTNGYKSAIAKVFEAVKILKGEV